MGKGGATQEDQSCAMCELDFSQWVCPLIVLHHRAVLGTEVWDSKEKDAVAARQWPLFTDRC